MPISEPTIPQEPPAKVRGRKPREARRGIVATRRVPEGFDPYIEQRQARAFDLSVQGISNRQIAQLLGNVSRDIVAKDILCEAARRAKERAADREAMIEHAVSRYEKVIGDVSLRVQDLLLAAKSETSWKAAASYRSIIPREMAILLRAQRQSEEVRGLLEMPGVVVNNNLTMQASAPPGETAMDLFDELPGDVKALVRRRAREMQMRNVTGSA